MKKINVFILFLIFNLLSSSAQHINDMLIHKGKVKSIHYLDYDVDSNGHASIGYGKFTAEVIVHYDQKGRKTEETYYSQPNQVYFKYEFLHDKKGHLLQSMTYFGEEESSQDGYHFSYDKKGKLVTDTFFYDARCKENNIYEYDQHGNLISASYFYWESLQHKTVYTYDDRGLCTEVFIQHFKPYSDNNTISYTEKIIYQYDAKGNKTQIREFETNNNLIITTDYKYNELGLLIEEKSINYEGIPYNWYEYDYDSHGNKIKIIYHSSEEPLIDEWTMKYEYDEKENWVKLTTSLNGKPIEIKTREIEYQ